MNRTSLRTPREGDRWIWVSLARATFAIAVRDGRVVDAAPYGRRYVGWSEEKAAAALRRNGARFAPLQ
jgi:hypothetical protein